MASSSSVSTRVHGASSRAPSILTVCVRYAPTPSPSDGRASQSTTVKPMAVSCLAISSQNSRNVASPARFRLVRR